MSAKPRQDREGRWWINEVDSITGHNMRVPCSGPFDLAAIEYVNERQREKIEAEK